MDTGPGRKKTRGCQGRVSTGWKNASMGKVQCGILFSDLVLLQFLACSSKQHPCLSKENACTNNHQPCDFFWACTLAFFSDGSSDATQLFVHQILSVESCLSTMGTALGSSSFCAQTVVSRRLPVNLTAQQPWLTWLLLPLGGWIFLSRLDEETLGLQTKG